jgi:protein-S-isoprenylcysteine O-methyltransferase Ste14
VVLVACLLLHVAHPRTIAVPRCHRRSAGVLLILAGLTLAAWATREAGEMDVACPDRLLVGGPYAFSRHPMYVGWTLIYLGVSLITASAGCVLLLPALIALVRTKAVREERRMEGRFGAAYLLYRSRVRRYL